MAPNSLGPDSGTGAEPVSTGTPIAVLTRGAGSTIENCAARLVIEGWDVVELAREPSPYGNRATDNQQQSNPLYESLNLVIEDLGRIDLLLLDVTIVEQVPWPDPLIVSMLDWNMALDEILGVAFAAVRDAATHMCRQRSGRILVVLPPSGLTGAGGSIANASAYGAVLGLVKSVALEAAEYGVLVNAVAAPLGDSALRAADSFASGVDSGPSSKASQRDSTVSDLLLYLAGEDSYTCGQVIIVNEWPS